MPGIVSMYAAVWAALLDASEEAAAAARVPRRLGRSAPAGGAARAAAPPAARLLAIFCAIALGGCGLARSVLLRGAARRALVGHLLRHRSRWVWSRSLGAASRRRPSRACWPSSAPSLSVGVVSLARCCF